MRILRNPRTKLAVIILLALFVRLLGVTSRPIWYDEAFSILFSERGLSAMLYGTLTPTGAGTADIHPLGYYVLLDAWMELFGQTLLAVRSLSVLAGGAIVVLSYILGRDLFNQNVGYMAAFLTALAPFQVHYSQEIRAYVFLTLWLLLATWAYVRGRTGHWSWWLLFAASSALAQYFHNLAVFYLIPLVAASVLMREWKTFRNVFMASLLAILLYLPWLVHLPAQIARVGQVYWIERPGVEKFFTLILIYITNLPLPNGWLGPALFAGLLIITLGIWQTIRRQRQNPPPALSGLWTLYLAFTPPILLFLISQARPVYIERALLPSQAIFCIWLAWALWRTNLPFSISNGLTVLFVGCALVGIYQHLFYAGFPYAPYPAMMADLGVKQQNGDVIVHSNKLSMLPSVYYDRQLKQIYVGDSPGSSTDTLAVATQQVLRLKAASDIQSAVGDARRVWFIIFDQSIREYAESGEQMHPHLAWLMQEYPSVEVQNWGSLRIYLFIRAP